MAVRLRLRRVKKKFGQNANVLKPLQAGAPATQQPLPQPPRHAIPLRHHALPFHRALRLLLRRRVTAAAVHAAVLPAWARAAAAAGAVLTLRDLRALRAQAVRGIPRQHPLPRHTLPPAAGRTDHSNTDLEDMTRNGSFAIAKESFAFDVEFACRPESGKNHSRVAHDLVAIARHVRGRSVFHQF
jgi:hypothetical protein